MILKENVFIFECLRLFVTGQGQYIMPKPVFLNDLTSWYKVIALSHQHNIAGFIAFVVGENTWVADLDQGVKASFKKALLNSQFASAEKKLHLKHVCSLFVDQDISLIVLKGAALSPFIYREIPFRNMSDIDLLIRPQDKEQIQAIFESNGFVNESSYKDKNRWHAEIWKSYQDIYLDKIGRYTFSNSAGLKVDIHIKPSYSICDRQHQLDWPQVWQRAVSWGEMGKRVYHLSQEDQLVFTAMHAIDRYNPQFIQLLDLSLLMKEFNLADISNRADLPKEEAEELRKFCQMVKDVFFLQDVSSEFEEKAAHLTTFFLDRSHCKDGLKIFFFSLYERIRSKRIKLKLLLGLLLPDPLYYKKHHPILRYFVHWKDLGRSIFSFVMFKYIRGVKGL